jgi:hypothetical protein
LPIALQTDACRVDNTKVIVVFAFVTAVFAAAAVVLLIIAVGIAAEGALLPAALSAGFALLAVYGAYLFGRSAWRTRHDARARLFLLIPSLVTAAVVALRLPDDVLPGARIILGVGAFVAVAAGLAAAFEPPKPRRPGSNGRR